MAPIDAGTGHFDTGQNPTPQEPGDQPVSGGPHPVFDGSHGIPDPWRQMPTAFPDPGLPAVQALGGMSPAQVQGLHHGQHCIDNRSHYSQQQGVFGNDYPQPAAVPCVDAVARFDSGDYSSGDTQGHVDTRGYAGAQGYVDTQGYFDTQGHAGTHCYVDSSSCTGPPNYTGIIEHINVPGYANIPGDINNPDYNNGPGYTNDQGDTNGPSYTNPPTYAGAPSDGNPVAYTAAPDFIYPTGGDDPSWFPGPHSNHPPEFPRPGCYPGSASYPNAPSHAAPDSYVDGRSHTNGRAPLSMQQMGTATEVGQAHYWYQAPPQAPNYQEHQFGGVAANEQVPGSFSSLGVYDPNAIPGNPQAPGLPNLVGQDIMPQPQPTWAPWPGRQESGDPQQAQQRTEPSEVYGAPPQQPAVQRPPAPPTPVHYRLFRYSYQSGQSHVANTGVSPSNYSGLSDDGSSMDSSPCPSPRLRNSQSLRNNLSQANPSPNPEPRDPGLVVSRDPTPVLQAQVPAQYPTSGNPLKNHQHQLAETASQAGDELGNAQHPGLTPQVPVNENRTQNTPLPSMNEAKKDQSKMGPYHLKPFHQLPPTQEELIPQRPPLQFKPFPQLPPTQEELISQRAPLQFEPFPQLPPTQEELIPQLPPAAEEPIPQPPASTNKMEEYMDMIDWSRCDDASAAHPADWSKESDIAGSAQRVQRQIAADGLVRAGRSFRYTRPGTNGYLSFNPFKNQSPAYVNQYPAYVPPDNDEFAAFAALRTKSDPRFDPEAFVLDQTGDRRLNQLPPIPRAKSPPGNLRTEVKSDAESGAASLQKEGEEQGEDLPLSLESYDVLAEDEPRKPAPSASFAPAAATAMDAEATDGGGHV